MRWCRQSPEKGVITGWPLRIVKLLEHVPGGDPWIFSEAVSNLQLNLWFQFESTLWTTHGVCAKHLTQYFCHHFKTASLYHILVSQNYRPGAFNVAVLPTVCMYNPMGGKLGHGSWECLLLVLLILQIYYHIGFLSYCEMKVKVAQSCLTLCDPMDYTVHEILQARILEWVVFLLSRGSSQPRDRTQVSHIAGGFFTSWATDKCISEFWVNEPF